MYSFSTINFVISTRPSEFGILSGLRCYPTHTTPQPTPSPLPLQALLDFPSPNYKSGSADPGSVINKPRWAGLG